MNFNKKAIESYVLVLLIVSALLTLLITTVFSPLFANDHPSCQDFEFEITSKKKTNNGANIKLKNTGSKKINFQFNSERKKDSLKIDETNEYQVVTTEDSITIMPIHIDTKGEVHECEGKKEKINTNTLI